MRRARLTPEDARDMYEDILDRVAAEREKAEEGAAPDEEGKREEAEQETETTPQARRIGKLPERVKATFYLRPEDIVAIDRIQSEEFLRTGKKPQRSEIVSRAIQLLAERELHATEA